MRGQYSIEAIAWQVDELRGPGSRVVHPRSPVEKGRRFQGEEGTGQNPRAVFHKESADGPVKTAVSWAPPRPTESISRSRAQEPAF